MNEKMDGNNETSLPKLFSPCLRRRGGGEVTGEWYNPDQTYSTRHPYGNSLQAPGSTFNNPTTGEQSQKMEARSRHWSNQNPHYTDFLADLRDDCLRRWRHQKVQVNEAPAPYRPHKSYRDYYNYTKQWQLLSTVFLCLSRQVAALSGMRCLFYISE